MNEAHFNHLLSSDDLHATLASSPGRRTVALTGRQPPTRSHFERTFLAMLDRHHLPRPEVNTRVHGYEVDMLWRPQRLIAELDGRQHELAFETDRERDAHLLAHGLGTIRITWHRLTTQEGREARRIRHLLAQRHAGKD